VIGKVLRGGSVGALVRYLYGPGRANEHLDPRIVAGWRPPERLEPAVSAAGKPDFRRLVTLLRERRVLGLLAAGHSNAEIAGLLDIAVPTVKFHVSHLLKELGQRDRKRLMVYAHRNGIS